MPGRFVSRIMHELVRTRDWVVAGYIRKWIVIGSLIGVVAGLGSLLLYIAIDFFTNTMLFGISGFLPPPTGVAIPSIRFPSTPFGMYLIPVSTTLGGLVSGLLVYGLAPEAEGHGTDAAIEAFHFRKGIIRRRIPPIKLLASAVTIGSGGSAGREGPVAQIASGFGSMIADLFKMDEKDRRTALAAGIGAGIGSIFMAPLGGALLSTEVLYRRDFEVEALIPSIIASVTGYSIFGYFFNYRPLFTISNVPVGFYHPEALILYTIIGAVTGLLGILYVMTFYGIKSRFQRLKRLPRFVRPALGGLLVGIAGIEFPQVLGLGYGWVQLLLSGKLSVFSELALPPLVVIAILILLKIVCTSLSIGSGGSGGVYAPGIVIGSFTGAVMFILFHTLFPYLSIADVVIVSMISFTGSVTKAPISIMIMGTEMTGGYALFLPLMLATVVSYFISGTKYSIYSSQVLDRAHSPAHQSEYERPLMDYIQVSEALERNVISASYDTTVAGAKRLLEQIGGKGIVVTANGAVEGFVTKEMLLNSPQTAELDEICLKNVPSIEPNKSLHAAFNLLVEKGANIVAVAEDGKVHGIVTMEDIAKAYNRNISDNGS